ncbi:MAG: 50S ribosomal protein L11 methyltransferase [Oscillospiraceae bacterium]|jgi:ribosomal protein L11 methyltransferase|nr:50S ribosomal protein L11 methyltransferase [Oscillospiraceae bacterium]
MEWAEISLKTTTEGLEIVTGFLMAQGVSSVMIEDAADFNRFLKDTEIHWDYVDEELMGLASCDTTVKFYLPDNPQGFETLNQIKAALPGLQQMNSISLGSLALTVSYREEEEWETAWKKYYHPIVIGPKLAVVPEWEDFTPIPGQQVLRLDPGMAFGTGGHHTTRLCLGFLCSCPLEGAALLDMGCGSGILSIAARLLGAETATGVDIDQLAVKISHENAALNGVDDERLTLYCGNVLGDEALADKLGERQYDVITANIVADVIIAMAPLFARYLKQTGQLLVSGIISERAEEVLSVLRENGFTLLEMKEESDWAAAVLVKGIRVAF